MSTDNRDMVLFIDDDVMPTAYYKMALEQSGYRVHQCYGPNSTLEALNDQRFVQTICAVILDAMMPSERFGDAATEGGMSTGAALFPVLREILPPKLPILILSNVDDEQIRSKFPKEEAVLFRRKIDLPPLELVYFVDQVTGRRRSPP